MNAVNDSGAKTVNVTIIKGGEEYSFKYNADRLSRYMEGNYSKWDMAPHDREEFGRRFGTHDFISGIPQFERYMIQSMGDIDKLNELALNYLTLSSEERTMYKRHLFCDAYR